jgi:hypothetical protein
MELYDRPQIVTILYNEVIQATQFANETKHTDPKAHREAQAALEKAVQRYTDFTLDGKIPEDFKMTLASRG